MDADAAQHEASRALLEAARDPSTMLYVTLQILCEFDFIVTNARRFLSQARLATHNARFPACSLFFMCCPFQPG
jgi:hypothetical protein